MGTDQQSSNYSKESLSTILAQYISSKERIAHSLRVAETSKQLVKMHVPSATEQNSTLSIESQAYIAGALHDIAKELTPLSLQSLHPNLDAGSTLYTSFAPVWHAFIGPSIISELFPNIPPSCLDAMRWHSTGKADMSCLEKILYVADFTEPGRAFAAAEEARNIAKHNLDEAVLFISNYSIQSLLERQFVIHPETLSCRNYYLRACS